MMKRLFIFLTFIFCFMQDVSYSKDFFSSKSTKVHVFRLKPNQDLKKEIQNIVNSEKIKAGYIITCVGSLKKLSIRLANEKNNLVLDEKFEIVSLVGTVSENGSHIHISISDKTGKTIGGHLSDGNIIYTTAEIVIGEIDNLNFKREEDKESGFKELSIYEEEKK